MSKPTKRNSHTGTCYYSDKENRWIAEFRWTHSKGEVHRKKFSDKSENVVRSNMFFNNVF